MKKILVTGANGFVGRALCEKMVAEQFLVRGTLRSLDVTDLPEGVEPVQIRSISADTDWSETVSGVDAVVHLAARVHVMNDTAADPLAAFREVNVAGTERLARAAAASGVRRFVYLSSVKVNGEGGPAPYTEKDQPSPQDPYGVSRWEAEQILYRVAEETGLEIVIIRPPLVYGPGVKANFLRLLDLVGLGVPIPFASIDNSRSFVYIGNLVDAIILCATTSKAAGGTYLVSDGDDLSTPELIRRLADALGVSARLFPFPTVLFRLAGKLFNRTDEVDRLTGSLMLDISRIQHDLGWNPPCTMQQGLVKTVEWYAGTRKTGSQGLEKKAVLSRQEKEGIGGNIKG